MTAEEYAAVTDAAERVTNRSNVARQVVARLADGTSDHDAADALLGIEQMLRDNIADLQPLRGSDLCHITEGLDR